jgi:hypothetical protein
MDGCRLPDSVLTSPPLGGEVTPPPNLIGLTPFQFFLIPEPSVLALGVLGAATLLLRRRK